MTCGKGACASVTVGARPGNPCRAGGRLLAAALVAALGLVAGCSRLLSIVDPSAF